MEQGQTPRLYTARPARRKPAARELPLPGGTHPARSLLPGRFLQLQEKGIHEDYEKVLDDLIKRDKQDMSRETDPLKKAEDAVEVDTSEMTFQESVDEILRIIREAFSGV